MFGRKQVSDPDRAEACQSGRMDRQTATQTNSSSYHLLADCNYAGECIFHRGVIPSTHRSAFHLLHHLALARRSPISACLSPLSK